MGHSLSYCARWPSILQEASSTFSKFLVFNPDRSLGTRLTWKAWTGYYFSCRYSDHVTGSTGLYDASTPRRFYNLFIIINQAGKRSFGNSLLSSNSSYFVAFFQMKTIVGMNKISCCYYCRMNLVYYLNITFRLNNCLQRLWGIRLVVTSDNT